MNTPSLQGCKVHLMLAVAGMVYAVHVDRTPAASLALTAYLKHVLMLAAVCSLSACTAAESVHIVRAMGIRNLMALTCSSQRLSCLVASCRHACPGLPTQPTAQLCRLCSCAGSHAGLARGLCL